MEETKIELSPNGYCRTYLKKKGYRLSWSGKVDEERFINDKGHTVVLYYKENKGIRLINKKGYSLYYQQSISEETFNRLFSLYNESTKNYPDSD